MFTIMFSQKSWSPVVDWYLGNKGGGEFRATIKLERKKNISVGGWTCWHRHVIPWGTVSNGRLASYCRTTDNREEKSPAYGEGPEREKRQNVDSRLIADQTIPPFQNLKE